MIESWEKIIDPNFISAELIGEAGAEKVGGKLADLPGRFLPDQAFHLCRGAAASPAEAGHLALLQA
jgi:hypothetical protein